MPDPTAIRLASEARRADLADELYSSVVEMHNLIDKAYQDERAAHLATLDLLAKAGADPGGRAPFDFDERMNEEAAAYAKMRMAWQDATGCDTPADVRAVEREVMSGSPGSLADAARHLRRFLTAESEQTRRLGDGNRDLHVLLGMRLGDGAIIDKVREVTARAEAAEREVARLTGAGAVAGWAVMNGEFVDCVVEAKHKTAADEIAQKNRDRIAACPEPHMAATAKNIHVAPLYLAHGRAASPPPDASESDEEIARALMDVRAASVRHLLPWNEQPANAQQAATSAVRAVIRPRLDALRAEVARLTGSADLTDASDGWRHIVSHQIGGVRVDLLTNGARGVSMDHREDLALMMAPSLGRLRDMDAMRAEVDRLATSRAAAESEAHRVAVAAAEVTAERDALAARVAELEAVVKAAASTLHVYVGEDFEVCRVCGIEDAKADHVDLDAYARGRDAADPVTVPAPDRAEELIIAQYDGCRKVAAELGHDGNWYAWGEWCRVNPNARSIQVEAMRRAIVGLAHGRAASPPPDASGPASDAELTALWSKTGGSVTASNRALYNHGVAYGRAKAATVPVGVAPDMDRVNMISALHAAAFDHGVACGRGKDPTEHQRREGDALDKLMAAFAYPAAKMPAGDAGFLGHDDAEVDAASVIAGSTAALWFGRGMRLRAAREMGPPTPSPRYVAVKRDEVNGRPASWFHTEAEAERYVALCNDNPDLFGADDEIEGALESYTHAVVDTGATPPAALPQVEAFGLPAVEWTRDEDNDTDPDDETSHTAWRPGDGIRSEYASTWFEAGAVGWSLLLDGTAPDEPTARARVEAAVALLTGRAEVRR